MTDIRTPLPVVLEPHRGTVSVAIVLGSGFGGLADMLPAAEIHPYDELEGHPVAEASVPGHQGRLLLGDIEGRRVAIFQGRYHVYQGVNALEAAWTARMAAALGCTTLILTNAAGGVVDHLSVGDVMLVEDQINLTGMNPLIGWQGHEGGVPFVSMSEAYDEALRALALDMAVEEGIALHTGVYAGLVGPSFETPAEVTALRTLGADVVGMSMVLETIAARALGLRVLGLSLVANTAADAVLSHEEVLAAGDSAHERLTHLLLALLRKM